MIKTEVYTFIFTILLISTKMLLCAYNQGNVEGPLFGDVPEFLPLFYEHFTYVIWSMLKRHKTRKQFSKTIKLTHSFV